MTNVQTGVGDGLVGRAISRISLGGGNSVGLGLAEGPFTRLRGKHEMPSFRGTACDFNTNTHFFFASICAPFIHEK